MKVSDIANLLKQKMLQRGQLDRNTNRLSFADYEIEAIASEVSVELSTRFTRPVITFTRQDALSAASQAGFQIVVVESEGAPPMAVPVDSVGVDIYDKLHRLIDWAFCNVMSRLPERELQKDLNRAQP